VPLASGEVGSGGIYIQDPLVLGSLVGLFADTERHLEHHFQVIQPSSLRGPCCANDARKSFFDACTCCVVERFFDYGGNTDNLARMTQTSKPLITMCMSANFEIFDELAQGLLDRRWEIEKEERMKRHAEAAVDHAASIAPNLRPQQQQQQHRQEVNLDCRHWISHECALD
jgi:hypothetical protein